PPRELFARPADVKRDLRLLVPAGTLALEEMAEETPLQGRAVARIEMREVGVAVHFEPFLPGAGGEIALEIAPAVQPLAAPVRRGQHRYVDLGEVGRARAVVVVDQRPSQSLAGDIGAVLGKLFLRQGRRTRDRLAGDDALGSALADAVLHVGHL